MNVVGIDLGLTNALAVIDAPADAHVPVTFDAGQPLGSGVHRPRMAMARSTTSVSRGWAMWASSLDVSPKLRRLSAVNRRFHDLDQRSDRCRSSPRMIISFR